MLNIENLKTVLSRNDISRRDKCLTLLVGEGISARTVSRIRELGLLAGMTSIAKCNISADLSRAGGLAIRVPEGWEITPDGIRHLQSLGIHLRGIGAAKVATGLRVHLSAVVDPETNGFLAEAVSCFEAGYYRAAIVFSWVGAAWVLQRHVFSNHLTDFNAEAIRRDSKSKPIKAMDDFSRFKEYDFLQIISAMSIIGKNVKEQLEERLKLRNGCGHPNSMQVGENIAAAHIEVLLQNVYQKFNT